MIPKDLTALDIHRGQKASILAASLNGMVDVDLLLSKILTNARQVACAEAGTVYLVSKGKLKKLGDAGHNHFIRLQSSGSHLGLNQMLH